MTKSLHQTQSAAERYFSTRYPGFYLTNFYQEENGMVRFELEHQEDYAKCPKCGTLCVRFKQRRTKIIYDWDMIGCGPVEIIMPVRQVRCPVCKGQGSEHDPDWILPGHRITKRLGVMAQGLLQHR